MVAITSPDGPLALSRRRLHDAVVALADPTPVAVDGVYRWEDPTDTRLRAALRGRLPHRRTAVFRSSSPCRLDVLELLCAIDTTAAGWGAR